LVRAARLERALGRASGGRGLGSLIHFTVAFHPAARITGRHFIEDIRAFGTNAIGMGLPWWEEGGGENHPDGVVMEQSVWIDGEQLIDAGRIAGRLAAMPAYRRLPRRGRGAAP
jgi:2,5-dihydroxypyridine 5,6-dioxygenase